MSPTETEKPYMTPYEVAELLMVAPVTVRAWAQKGLLRSRTTPGGHRRFRREDVEHFARASGVCLAPAKSDALRVLIVDDNPLCADLLNELLLASVKPVATAIAYDGFEAGSKIHTFRPDVVLLDLIMPGLDGFRVCRQIKQGAATSAVRVIAVTGSPAPENQRRCLEEGAACCLGKPVNAEKLLAALAIDPVAATPGK
jgi:excisionase family DNA binding protein